MFDDLSLASSAQSDASTYNDEGIRLLPQVPHFDISDVQYDRACQTDAPVSQTVDKAVQAGVQPLLLDIASQWEPLDVPVQDEELSKSYCHLEDSLGFSDKLLPRDELRQHAQMLLANGLSVDEIADLSNTHWERIDDIRPADILIRLDGQRWHMHGDNGRCYITDSANLRVRSIPNRGYVQGACLVNHTYGRVSVADYIFNTATGKAAQAGSVKPVRVTELDTIVGSS